MLGRFGSVVGSNVIGLLINTHCILTFYLFSGFIICKYIGVVKLESNQITVNFLFVLVCGVLTLFIPS